MCNCIQQMPMSEGLWRGWFWNLYTWRKQGFLKVHHNLKARSIGPYKVLKKIGSAAYSIDLSYELLITPIFNVSDLYLFRDSMEKCIQLQIKSISYQKCSQILLKMCYMLKKWNQSVKTKRFFVKMLGKPISESIWMTEDELKDIDPTHVEVTKAFLMKLSSPTGKIDAGTVFVL